MKVNDAQFFDQVKNAKRVLIVDLGYLGDTIQLIPALWSIRKALPEAKIEIMVSSHVQSILKLTPWIDKIISYPRFPKRPPFYKDIIRSFKLRKEGYDAIINLSGSQRSCWLTWMIGAPLRLGRIERRPFWFRRHAFTHGTQFPFEIHVSLQRLECLEQVGFPKMGAEYPITIPTEVMNTIDLQLDGKKGFIHISSSTNVDYRELSMEQLAEVINAIVFKYPDQKIALSCSPTQRELGKLEVLLGLLDNEPWKVFAGTLSVLELTALMTQAKMHLGGDSGAMHVAQLAQVPVLAWFRVYPDMAQSVPCTGTFKVLYGEACDTGIQGIDTQDILDGVDELMQL